MCLRRMSILCCLMKYFYMSVSSIGLKYVSDSFPHWFPVWITYPLLKVEYWSPLQLLDSCLFTPSDLYLLNAFRCSDVGCIYIYDYYSFLTNCLPYHYIMTVFVFLTFLPRVYFVWSKYSYSCSLGFHLHRISFAILHFWVYVCP